MSKDWQSPNKQVLKEQDSNTTPGSREGNLVSADIETQGNSHLNESMQRKQKEAAKR